MKRLVPLSLTVSDGVVQLVVLRLVFCWRFQPVEGDGQETMAVLLEVRNIPKAGAPGVWTA